jgi:hypothetical protein
MSVLFAVSNIARIFCSGVSWGFTETFDFHSKNQSQSQGCTLAKTGKSKERRLLDLTMRKLVSLI